VIAAHTSGPTRRYTQLWQRLTPMSSLRGSAQESSKAGRHRYAQYSQSPNFATSKPTTAGDANLGELLAAGQHHPPGQPFTVAGLRPEFARPALRNYGALIFGGPRHQRVRTAAAGQSSHRRSSLGPSSFCSIGAPRAGSCSARPSAPPRCGPNERGGRMTLNARTVVHVVSPAGGQDRFGRLTAAD
jgi:hypothetical protein